MPKRQKNTDETKPVPLSTDFALACDGHLYVSAEILSEEERRGRKQFVGYRLTEREQAAATEETLRMAFNLRGPIRAAMREERSKKTNRARKSASTPAT